MSTIANAHQFEAWNGYEGQHWADNQDRYDAIVGGSNRPLFEAARIEQAAQVLDFGCGTGLTTRRAAMKAADGHALGVDLSEPMLRRARETAAEKGISNVTFEQGDVQVHPFPADAFDVAISRGGTWYFDDPVAAYANIGAALRPGGRLAMTTPDSTADTAESQFPDILAIMAEYLPQAPTLTTDDERQAQTTMSSPDAIRDVLSAAGFTAVEVTPHHDQALLGKTATQAVEFIFGWGPVRHWFRHAEAEIERQARSAVRAALAPHESPGGVRQPGSAFVVTAVRN